MKAKSQPKTRKHTSPSLQTIRIQHRLAQWTQSQRKHWDLYRWILNPIILGDAIDLVLANAGSAGIDGISCEQLKGREMEIMVELREKLRNRTYRPKPVKRCWIPKRDGRKRPLGIPTLEDRIVQRALTLILEPIFEQIFLPCSFGFRPRQKAVDCVAKTAKAVYQHRHVFEADIEGFFDHVSHRKLLRWLKVEIIDPRILDLIHAFLKAGVWEQGKGWLPSEKGTPQGGPLSPLLANIFLHYALDVRFQNVLKQNSNSLLFRYADDFVILSRTQKELLTVKRCLSIWMKEADLKLKKKKTRVIDMRNKVRSRNSHFDFLGFRIHLRAFRDNPNRFWVARQPSESARKALKANLKEKLKPNLPLYQAKTLALAIWKGWAGYFRFGNANHVFYREVYSVHRALNTYLQHKYRHQRRPVPWRKLRPLARYLQANIRPLKVIPDSLRQKQGSLALSYSGRAVYRQPVRTVR